MPSYGQKLLDHFRHPRNAGVIEDADGVAVVANPTCGDTMKLYLRVRKGTVIEARWQTRGCSASIAASSVASELIAGRPIEEARGLTRKVIADALGGLPPAKAHGAALALDAVRAALKDYAARRRGGVRPAAGAAS